VRQRQLNALSAHVRQLFDWQLSGFRTAKPMCVVQCAPSGGGAQIPNNTYNYVTFTTEIVDTDGMWSGGSAVRINTPGIYLLDWRAALVSVPDVDTLSYIAAIIFLNGVNAETDAIAFSRQRYPANTPVQCHASAVAALDLGTFVYFGVVQRTTEGQSVSVDVSNGGAVATLEWLAPLDADIGATE
jgi:hypothetical protein